MLGICLRCVASPSWRRKITIGSVSKEKTFNEFQNEGAPSPQQSDPGLLDNDDVFWLHGGVSSIKFWFFNQLNFLQITWFLGKILSRIGSNGKLGKLPCESSRCRALQMVVLGRKEGYERFLLQNVPKPFSHLPQRALKLKWS